MFASRSHRVHILLITPHLANVPAHVLVTLLGSHLQQSWRFVQAQNEKATLHLSRGGSMIDLCACTVMASASKLCPRSEWRCHLEDHSRSSSSSSWSSWRSFFFEGRRTFRQCTPWNVRYHPIQPTTAGRESGARQETASLLLSDTTCRTHLVQPAIQRRQLRRPFRASTSSQQSRCLACQSASPRGQQLRVCGLLLLASLDKRCPVLLRGSTLWLPGSAESTPHCDVDCQLGPVEARQILCQHLDAPLVIARDAQVHVAQIRIELHAEFDFGFEFVWRSSFCPVDPAHQRKCAWLDDDERNKAKTNLSHSVINHVSKERGQH